MTQDSTPEKNKILTTAEPTAFGFFEQNQSQIILNGSNLKIDGVKCILIIGGDI